MSIAQTIRLDTKARAVLLLIGGEDFSSGDLPDDLTVESALQLARTLVGPPPGPGILTVPDGSGYRTLWTRDSIILVVAHQEFPPAERLARLAAATIDTLAEHH